MKGISYCFIRRKLEPLDRAPEAEQYNTQHSQQTYKYKSSGTSTGSPHKQCVCLCSKYKEMYGRILKSLNIVNLYREMFNLKLKINVKVPQLLCIVVDCCYTL